MEESGDLLVVTPGTVLAPGGWQTLKQGQSLCTVLPSRSDVIRHAISSGLRKAKELTAIGDEYFADAFKHMRWAQQRGTAVILPMLPQGLASDRAKQVIQELDNIHLVTGPTRSAIITDERLAQHAVRREVVDAAVNFLTEI